MSKFLILPEADGTKTAVLAADIYGVTKLARKNWPTVLTLLNPATGERDVIGHNDAKPENSCSVLVSGHEYPIFTTLDFDTIVAAAEIALEDEDGYEVVDDE